MAGGGNGAGIAIGGGLVAALALAALFFFGGNPTATPPIPGLSPGPGGGGGLPPGVDGSPRTLTAVVERTAGRTPVAPGHPCTLIVQPVPEPSLGYWCHAELTCAGYVLYGGGEAGYFPCRVERAPRADLIGSDPDTSARDSDPAFEIDTRAGVITIRDDARGRYGAYEMRARVTSVR